MAEGCSTGDELYPNSTHKFDLPYNVDVERYYETNPIHIRNYRQDPTCGIPRELIVRTGKRCVIGLTGERYGEGISLYNPSDYVCLPLDDYCPALLTLTMILVLVKPKRLLNWFNK